MSYGTTGDYPIERASKLGHMKVIEHEHVRRLLRQFENVTSDDDSPVGKCDGRVDLEADSPIKYIITIDGGQAVIPNEVRRDKRVAFISVCAMLVRREDIAGLHADPIIDPRDLTKMFEDCVWYQPAALPLAGIRIPGETVKETVRDTIDAVLEYSKLYEDLHFLVYRKWNPDYEMEPVANPDAPHMNCLMCKERVYLPKDAFNFQCTKCKFNHRLSDYLGIAQQMPDNWSREEAASSLRNAMETLTLLHFIFRYWNKPDILSKILFLKDGPLLLRAQLSRLVEPIRDFVQMLKKTGTRLNLTGVEKNGELVDHLDDIKKYLKQPGDYFLPSIQYMFEEVSGITFDPTHYRNRVQYGAKIVIRLGPDHVIPLDIATGDFCMKPILTDLIGSEDIAVVLSEMISYSHDNALIPVKLANSFSSISQQPSGDILQAFANQLIS